jgi:hypothetical protein
MNAFAASVHEHPVAYEAELVTYDTLALPFAPLVEIEERRQVLEDCQAFKQRYWSAISQLEFTQTPEGRLIFVELPPVADLALAAKAFRKVLNSLMEHARQVATGAIKPTVFVPENEPILPQFKRGSAGNFATFWQRRDDPALLRDEKSWFAVLPPRFSRF